MKKIVSTGFIILTICFKGLSQFYDDFSDGDYRTMPVWEDTLENFVVRDGMLSLSGPAVEGNASIITGSNYAIEATWEFRIKLDFNPSGYNYADVYLSSDSPDLSGHIYGYFIRIGGAKDEISLYARNGYQNQVTQMTSGPAGITDHDLIDFRIKVTRNNYGEWQLFYSDAGIIQYVKIAGYQEGPVFQVSNYFGIICTYTPTRRDKFHFDDIKISGTEWADRISPFVDTIYCSGNGRIDCRLNEKIFTGIASDPANYHIEGFGSPDSAVYDPAASMISLFWDEQFSEGNILFLEITSMMDLAGNVSLDYRTSFIYHDIIPAFSGALVINEIMADPDPPVGLPVFEYVEVINVTGKYVLLDGCRLNDQNIGKLIIPPKESAIISDVEAEESFRKFNRVMGLVNNWDNINNEEEEILLTAKNGEVLDAVRFQREWIGDRNKRNGGWSLELINPDFSCWGQKSWQVSNAESGGTPGEKNSVYSVNVQNQTRGFRNYQASENSLTLEFSDPVSLNISKENFSLIGKEILDILQEPGTASFIQLTLSDSLEPGLPHTLSIRSLMDCTLTYRIDTSISLGLGIPSPFLGIIITEIMIDANPSRGLPEEEYIELFNPGSKIINLAGSALVTGSDTIELPDKCLLPKEYRILCSTDRELIDFPHTLGISRFPLINDNGERMSILGKNRNLIFDLDLNFDFFHDGIQGGISLEMIDVHNPCGQESNWSYSINTSGGTPGKINSIQASNPDNLGPVLESVTAATEEMILLRFTEPVHTGTIDVNNISVNDRRIIQSYLISDLKEIGIYTLETLKPGIIYQLRIRNITDCAGNLLLNKDPVNFALPEPADSSDIVINEVLFNPVPGGVDYIEILNKSGKFIDLKNWRFSTTPEFSSYDSNFLSDVPFIISPGSVKAFTRNRQRTINDFPRSDLSNILEMDKMPSMNDDKGTIIIHSDQGKLIDRFDYTESLHYPLLNHYEGVSLERIDPGKPAGYPNNWHSASAQCGFGTPGERNSSVPSDSLIIGEVFIDPAVFSPENTVANNQAFIYFNFGQPGYVASVFVFDVNGRMIRNLANNKLLSASGQIPWDGICDNGKKAGMGYYIIVLEVFNLDGTIKIFKNKVAIGAYF